MQQIKYYNVKYIHQAINECQQKEEQLTARKEKLESDKVKLLASVRAETQDLQEKKEKLQTKLVDLNKAVDETKSEVLKNCNE